MSPLPPRFHLLHCTLPLLSLLHSQSQFTITAFFLVKHLHLQRLPIGRPPASVSSSTTATGLHSLHGNNMLIEPTLLAVSSSRIIDLARNVFLIPHRYSDMSCQWPKQCYFQEFFRPREREGEGRSQGSGWSLTRVIQETIQSKASKKKQKDSKSSRNSSRRQMLQRKLSIKREDRRRACENGIAIMPSSI
ncbi:hypothetical protein VNO77_03566 [Canavalia gladiata]|uniref:Uncharacterized protein n=1 Tax=Canavalia gladiata TaxID=3824 RepID=A0AAN9MZZ7_CANGL